MTWVKGQSGNPLGRPHEVRALMAKIRERGDELVDWLFDIAGGKLDPENPLAGTPRPPERVKAIEVLMAYGFGKPVQAIELTGANGGPVETRSIDTRKLSDEQQASLHALLKQAEVVSAKPS